VWDAIVYDKDLDQIYLGVGNGNPWNHGTRSNGEGDNWFLSSVVALDATTGAYKWHYQETPAESWDFTATQPIILAEQAVNGKPDQGALPRTEERLFFTIDRANGKLIDAKPFVDGINWATGIRHDDRPPERESRGALSTGPASFLSPFRAHLAHTTGTR
jgi:quinohemoprotein ethanol dehydrogenase